MSVFATLWQASMPALDATFGRKVRVIAGGDGPYVWTANPDIPEFEVVGVLDTRPLALRQLGGNKERADQSDRVSAKCTIDFDARAFALPPARLPEEGWRIITVPSQQYPQAEAFEVTWRDPSGEGRVVLHIMPVSQ